ncbi:rhodanese-like domain-containing protein 14, chloroplastic [Nymphaea colorata]|nr:rhodanese-like domain-containing protein 14, chloroplastic [Nymphaea colorata]
MVDHRDKGIQLSTTNPDSTSTASKTNGPTIFRLTHLQILIPKRRGSKIKVVVLAHLPYARRYAQGGAMSGVVPISTHSFAPLPNTCLARPNHGVHFCRTSLLPFKREGASRSLTVKNAATKTPKTPAEEDWKIKREFLLKKKVRSVEVKEALRLQQENGFVILDVRPEAEFKEGHPPGAINVQIYRLIKEWTAWDIARRAAFAFFGIFAGTEENPEFLKDVESKIEKSAKIIVACSSGGTMKPSQNLPEGQQSRSLIAAYLLTLNGYENVFHLEGGLYTWFKEDLPAVSEDETV